MAVRVVDEEAERQAAQEAVSRSMRLRQFNLFGLPKSERLQREADSVCEHFRDEWQLTRCVALVLCPMIAHYGGAGTERGRREEAHAVRGAVYLALPSS